MADGLKHPTDLLIPSLMEGHFKPGIVATLERSDLAWSESFLIDECATAQPIQVALSGYTRNLHVICLWNASGFRHGLCELAVVCKDDQTFGTKVQTTDRVNALLHLSIDILENRWPALGVARCRHYVLWFI